MTWSCADICDKYGDNVFYPDSFPFRHFAKTKKFCGLIRTVKCFEDNSKVKEILAQPGKGLVLVVDAGASTRRAVLGDLIAQSAVDHEWAGVVINGVIRDSEAITEMESLGVVALGTNPRKTERKNQGTFDEEIKFNGLTFIPGEWIYVDHDGMIVSQFKLEYS